MNLLFVLEHYPPYIGGAETLFGQLTRALAEQGHAVSVITTRFRNDLPATERQDGVTIRRIDCRNRFLFSLLALPQAWRAARTADIVHTTTYNAALPAWLGAKANRTPIVITFHEYWGDLWLRLPFIAAWRARAYRFYESRILRLPFDRYVAVSHFTARALVQAGVDAAKIARIPNGVNLKRLAPGGHQPDPGFHYLYFGRLGISKGLDILLPAAATLRASLPGARLRLVIPRTPRSFYRRVLHTITTLGIGDVVELYDELPEKKLFELLRRSSCVVIPSYSEGFCFAAAEAVALGIPIISSGRGALPETVSGRHLVMQDMTVESLVGCLLAAATGNYDSSPPRRYPLAHTVAEYLEFYAGLAYGH